MLLTGGAANGGGRGGRFVLASLKATYPEGHLGWSDPICRGATLPKDTIHPAPSRP